MIVDVFASERYTGNQLAVVMASDGMSGVMTDNQMQAVASEMNYSETSFITGGSLANGLDVRIFTPTAEIPFAGHPVLGTAYVAATELLNTSPEEIVLNLKAGPIPVTIEYSSNNKPSNLTMRQRPPEFGEVFDKAIIARVLGLDPRDISAKYPIEEVSTGLPFIIVPIEGLDAMGRISLDLGAYTQLIEGIRPKAILAFCVGSVNPDNHLHVRMFAPYYGITEDPATGSGCGCLAAYLLKYGVLGEGAVSARVEQGIEMGRPSILDISAESSIKDIFITVGGLVIPIAHGVLV